MINELINVLKKGTNNLYIQTHDFPDPDAIASAYGLQNFLTHYGIESKLVYCGEIQRTALQKMVTDLNINLYKENEVEIKKEDKIIIVDGCKGNQNVTDLPGREVAVIDHHIVEKHDDVEFNHIEPEIGSCATLITEYYLNNQVPVSENIATALMVGISRDTDMLTRKVTQRDINAYHYLYNFSNNSVVNTILRNNIQLSDFNHFKLAIDKLKRAGEIAWCYFEKGCSTNLMGIIGDFILSAHEIRFCLIIAKNSNSVSISIRNEIPNINAAHIAKEVTEGIGAGGGHLEMAGGVIYNAKNFDLNNVINKVMALTDA